jgi:hypothetical protein
MARVGQQGNAPAEPQTRQIVYPADFFKVMKDTLGR